MLPVKVFIVSYGDPVREAAIRRNGHSEKVDGASPAGPGYTGARREVFESFRVRVGPWSVHARRADQGGTGRPVVLVHGVVVAGRYMMPTAHALAEHRPVYIPDLPGFGRSEGPGKPLDVQELARSLAEWMFAAGLERADLVGHSFGCQIVSGLAARWPERVGRLVLLSPIGGPSSSLAGHIWNWMLDCPREPLSVWGSYVGGFLRFGPRRALGTLAHSVRDEMERRLPRIQAPALVVRGELDPIVEEPWARRVASLLPRGRLALMPGAPHNVNYKTPGELCRILVPFLESPDGTESGDDCSRLSRSYTAVTKSVGGEATPE